MKYIIMAAGNGKRWNNYTGVPKHLVKIKNEIIIERTIRLLKENGVNDIIINSSNKEYEKYGLRHEPIKNEYEIDRYYSCKDILKTESEVCFIYGDVYYTENAIKTIVSLDEEKFFGRLSGKDGIKGYGEIFAIKIKDVQKFLKRVAIIRRLVASNQIPRGIGWEVYKIYNGIPLKSDKLRFYKFLQQEKHPFFYSILDETEDLDNPKDYWSLENPEIVFYIPSIYIGGTTLALLNLIKKLNKKVFVVYNKNKNDIILNEFKKYSTIIKIEAEEIKCQTFVYCHLGGRVNLKAKKIIQWVHTAVEDYNYDFKKREADIWVTVSKEAKKQLDNRFNVNSKVIYNILNDVNTLSNEYIVDEKEEDLILVTISRLSKEKGLDRMILFDKELNKRDINYKWYIIGEGKEKKYLQDNMNKESTVFLGELINPYPYLKISDYGIMLSDRESYCLFVAEARTLNVPVIVTNWNGVEEQVVNKSNGYILNMDLSNLNIDEIIKKELKPKNIIESNLEEWYNIL